MREWIKWVSVLVLLSVGGVSNAYAYAEFQDLWRDYQSALNVAEKYLENKGVSFIKVNGEAVSSKGEVAGSFVEPVMEAGYESNQPSVQEIADKIFILESSGGINDSCRLKGMWNGYGYMQSKFYDECFNSQKEVRGFVENWIKDKLDKNYKTAELVCFYNRGIKTDSCEYATKFFSL